MNTVGVVTVREIWIEIELLWDCDKEVDPESADWNFYRKLFAVQYSWISRK